MMMNLIQDERLGCAMRRTTLGLFILLFPLSIRPQNPGNDLSGVWHRLQQDNSGEMNVKIDQKGADITITFHVRNQGANEVNVEHLQIGPAANANRIHGAPMTSHAAWEGATLLVDSVAQFGDEQLRMTDRWSLSANGQTLTLVERHQFGAEPSPATDTYVFDRGPEESWQEQSPPPTRQAAEKVYRNIQIFKGVPAERIPQIMTMFNRVLGVECTHCHVENAMDKGDKPTFAKARRMFQMRNWIAQEAKIESTCWTCHRGHATPESSRQVDATLWPTKLNLTAEQAARPAAEIYKNLKFFNSTAADVKSSMLFMSASLGVGCAHCHDTDALEKDDKPAKDAARRMLAMVRDSRREFTEIPIGCSTCHHGASNPEMTP
jgi:hypothetical protein